MKHVACLFALLFMGCDSENPSTLDGDVEDAGVDADDGDSSIDDADIVSRDGDMDDGDSDSDSLPVDSFRSAFGIFAGFTREYQSVEQAMGISHSEYLEWAGQQYDELGAQWTRSNLQLLWDLVEPEVGGGYDWDNRMGTEECFGSASAADVHYLAVFHEGGILDEGLRDQNENVDDYQRFVRDVVERYDGDGVDDAPGNIRITHWQVGNETQQIATLSSGADQYVSWFIATADAVREADPDAKMALIASTDSRTIDSLHEQVIPRLAEAGARFDVVDIHHWGSAEDVTMLATQDYQDLFTSLGLEDVELWSTEHGTHVGQITQRDAECVPACSAPEICVPVGPDAICVLPCIADDICPPTAPVCDVDSGRCVEPEQSLADQARSLVQRFVINRDRGVSLIMWNNLVSWHEFGGHAGGVFDRMGLVSGGFLEFETESDRGQPRPAWFAYQMLAARTDELWAESIGPVDLQTPEVVASAYRNRETGAVGWVAWAQEGTTIIERSVDGPGVQVVSFITDSEGTPTRDETIAANLGVVSLAVGVEPLWIEPLPD